MALYVTERQFTAKLASALETLDRAHYDGRAPFAFVTGPGRSGAIAAVYASHMLGIPFLPFKAPIEAQVGKDRLLFIDTAVWSGETLKKGSAFYASRGFRVKQLFVFDERIDQTRRIFWYEAGYQTQDYEMPLAMLGQFG